MYKKRCVFSLLLFTIIFAVTTTRAMESVDMDESDSAPNQSQAQLDKELYSALIYKEWEKIEPLLAQGADPNLKKNKPRFYFPLYCVAHATNTTKTLKILLQNNADPNEKNDQGENALHFIFCLKNMEYLLQSGTDPNHQNTNGATPLHCALYAEHALILLKYGADPTIKNNRGNTPLEDAMEYNPNVFATLQGWTKEQNNLIEEAIFCLRELRTKLPNDMLNLIVDMLRKNQMGSDFSCLEHLKVRPIRSICGLKNL